MHRSKSDVLNKDEMETLLKPPAEFLPQRKKGIFRYLPKSFSKVSRNGESLEMNIVEDPNMSADCFDHDQIDYIDDSPAPT
ncbi:unnamed protein product [Dimorphilus gyrociliatus]|uniref:Uncharacterized protein n=1 Tax=Dimorphilus gyrociliatus TaxID=2664684 RepID=A0A7I8VE96_9ANNE|nr:unnamed protein product [Dimorphilus gyrociliatus]